MGIRSFELLSVVIILWIIPSYCNEYEITKIGTEICDVTINERHYGIFKSVKPECPITYVEKIDFDHSIVGDKDLLKYLKSITSTYLHDRVDVVKLKAAFTKEHEGLYTVKILKSEGIILDFFYIHYIHKSTDYYVSVFSGIFQRLENSIHCKPTDDLVTWNDNTLERARLYFFYKALNSKKMIETALGSTCPALKYRPDL